MAAMVTERALPTMMVPCAVVLALSTSWHAGVEHPVTNQPVLMASCHQYRLSARSDVLMTART